HSHRHRHALFERLPLQGFFDTRRGIRGVEKIVGRRTQFFRPPFGGYSWAVLSGIRMCGVAPVHWTVEAHDWHPDFSPEDVTRKVLSEVQPGGVVCMHDGGRGGPRTIHALAPILAGLETSGLRAVPLSQMRLQTGLRSLVRSVQ